MAPNTSSLEDCTIIDVEEYEDASDGLVPMFVKHTEAMLDEIDRMVCAYSNSHIFLLKWIEGIFLAKQHHYNFTLNFYRKRLKWKMWRTQLLISIGAI